MLRFLLLFVVVQRNHAAFSIIEISQPINEHVNQSNYRVENSLNEIEYTDQLNQCSMKNCEAESIKVASFMDESINPCDDFYEFACGKFIRKTELPEDKDTEMSVTQVQDKIDKQLQSVLTEEIQLNEPKTFQLAKLFAQTCINEASPNENGKK